MASQESVNAKKCQLFFAPYKCALFRNNSGMFYNKNNAPVYFGLGNTNEKIIYKGQKKRVIDVRKSSDSIGWTQVLITPEMVGKTLAVFTSIEFKAPGFVIKKCYPEKSREAKQLYWINAVIRAGGIGGFVAKPADIKDIFAEFYERFA